MSKEPNPEKSGALPSKASWEALKLSCLLKDRPWLDRHFLELSKASKPALSAKWWARFARSRAFFEERQRHRPHPQFQSGLPVEEARQRIAEAIEQHQITIVCGETGSGKTTVIPQICLAMGRGIAGMIACTQPRRLAARTVSQRIASELKTELGAAVGFKIRFTDRVGDKTLIKVMTDGVLLAEIHEDRDLRAYDTIIIDEAHERSLNIDFLMGYCLNLVRRRPELKIILTSATLEAERLSQHLGGAPIIEVSGRTYPVDVHYLEAPQDPEDEEQSHGLVQALRNIVEHAHEGDVLVFLPGEREIREAMDLLRPLFPQWALLPLFSRLSLQDQDRVFKDQRGRRIVLATNVAETSITVPGIRYVVDTGLARIKRYSARTKVTLLQIEKISQAAATQRAGRAGRVMAGVCFRLYSKLDFDARSEFTTPEILRSSLAGVILRMEALGLGHVETFPFLDPPSPRLIDDGYQLLHELGAVEPGKALTTIGQQMARYPLDPRIARMIFAGHQCRALKEVLIIAAFLSIQDPRERPMDKRQAADEKHKVFQHEHSDFLSWLSLWAFFEEAAVRLSRRKLQALCQAHFLSSVRMREWRDVHAQLTEQVGDLDLKVNTVPATYEELHRALLAGLLGQVGLKDPQKEEYQGPRGIRFQLAPGSLNGKLRPKWVMAAELAETTRLFARGVAKIEPHWIEESARHLTQKTFFDPLWDRRAAEASIHEQISLYGLILVGRRRVRMGPVDPVGARKLFIRHALVSGEWDSRAGFFLHNQALVREVESLEHKSRRQDVLVDESVLEKFYDARLPPEVWSGVRFERWRREIEAEEPRILFMERALLMRHAAEAITPELFPQTFTVGPHAYPLSYRFEPGHPLDGVSLSVPIMALGQLSEVDLSWLVPGLVREKVQALLKSLPQSLRRLFVPLPQAVTDFLSEVTRQGESLEMALKRYVETRGEILPAAFKWPPLPMHLSMNIRLFDGQQRELGMGRNLHELKTLYGMHARALLTEALDQEGPDKAVLEWTWDEIPLITKITRHGRDFEAYPTLVMEAGQVTLKLLEDQAMAEAEMPHGLVGLLSVKLQSEIRQVLKQSAKLNSLSLLYVAVPRLEGSLQEAAEELRQDLVARVLMECLPEVPWRLRQRAQWETLLLECKRSLASRFMELVQCLLDILSLHQSIRADLSRPQAHHLKPALAEMDAHLRALFCPHWIRLYSQDRLQSLPRYLKAIEARWQRLPDQWQADAEKSAEIARLLERLSAARKRYGPSPRLDDFGWAIEELRVSFFAQALKTAFPVSVKRLDKDWIALERLLNPLK